MNERKICPACNDRLVAVNCYHKDKVYYRGRCDACIRKGKGLRPKSPLWFRQGYRKKPECDRCGFKSSTDKQMSVFHIDGNLRNVDWNNLKTICANCSVELHASNIGWKPSPNVPGF